MSGHAASGGWPRALARIGRHEEFRRKIVASCLNFEQKPERRHSTVRQDVTGPIVDALHEQAGIIRKSLSSGVRFEFHYRSRIARDFVMSVPEQPDHVWEPQTTRLLLHLTLGAEHVLVGGAYFGDHAVLMARCLAAHRGICHAFEPDREQATMLDRNVHLNDLANVRIDTRCLWSHTGDRLCLRGDDALGSAAPAADDDPAAIGTISVDDYLASQSIESVQVIALDVEGAELAILRGAAGQLALPPGRAPHVVCEVHGSYVDWSDGLLNTDVLKFLSSFGYTTYAIRDFQSNYDLSTRPIELVPPETAYLEGPPHGFNVLATKDMELPSRDLFVIRPGVSPKLLLHGDPALHHPIGGLP